MNATWHCCTYIYKDSGRSPSRRSKASWRSRRSGPARSAVLPLHHVQANPGCSWPKNWTLSGQPSRPCNPVLPRKSSANSLQKTKPVQTSEPHWSSPLEAKRGRALSKHQLECQCVHWAQCLYKQHSMSCKHWLLIKPLLRWVPEWLECCHPMMVGVDAQNKKAQSFNKARRKHSSSLQIRPVSSNRETDNGNCCSWITSWVATDNRAHPIITPSHPLAKITCPIFAYKVSN